MNFIPNKIRSHFYSRKICYTLKHKEGVNLSLTNKFRADNPGIWLMHCHKLSHSLEGQMLMLDVTDQGVPPLPPNFPTCPRKDAYTATDELVDIRSIGNTEYNDDEKSFSDKLLPSYILTYFMYLSLKH